MKTQKTNTRNNKKKKKIKIDYVGMLINICEIRIK